MRRRPQQPAPQDELLQPFAESVRDRVASREALLAEARALTRQTRTARKTIVGLLAGAGILGSLWHLDPAWHSEDIRVAVGQRQHLELKDGSQVELDSGSHLRIERRLRSRQLELIKGRAQFTVIHADKPFIVRSQDVRIRDIGTVFDVRSDSRGVAVGVIEGAVEVSSGETSPHPLLAGEQLLANARQVGPPHAADLGAMGAWRQGKLRFDAAPLSEVIVELQRYREAAILLADDRVGALRLSGEYDSNAVETLLQLLPSILPLRMSKGADGTVVLGTLAKK